MITNIKVTFFLATKSDKGSVTTINRIKKLFHEKNIEIYSNHENIFNLKLNIKLLKKVKKFDKILKV